MNQILHKIKNLSFGLQLLVVLTVLVLAIVFIGGEKIAEYERSYLADEARAQTERMFEVFLASNSDSIISEDSALLETAVKYVTAVHPEIIIIKVLNNDAKDVINWEKSAEIIDSNAVVFNKQIVYQGKHFGSVQIVRSMQASLEATEKHISNMFLIGFFLLAIFLSVLALITYFMISRPINIIDSRIIKYLRDEKDETEYNFYSREFNILNSSVDKLREITTGRDLLQDEMEVRIYIQFELEKARLAAEQANNAKTDFLSFMSHEIRTPLTAIIGFSENLLDYKQSMEERLEAIHTVINSSNHLLQLINDVLDISKIEAGHLETEEVKVGLVVLLREVASIVRALIVDKDIDFKVKCTEQVPATVTTDPLRLKQILINVISNAIKFTHEGAVTLVVGYDRETKDLSFNVIDTGIGMTAEQKENLFNAYSQADMSTARQYGGTGLGLYLSKNLAQKLGGGIHVDSSKGVGTVFRINIKAGETGELVTLQEDDLNQAFFSRVEKLDGKLSGHVLLADDVPENQKLITHYVKSMGADVDVASNGQEAVEMAQANNYDLILMDIRMPILDGFGAVRQLREKGNQVPVVALSANNMSEDVAEYMAAGFNATAAKPIVRTAFKDLLIQYLRPVEETVNEQGPIYSALLESEPEFIEVINLFLVRLPYLIAKISQSFESSDWDLLKQELHRTKGVAGNYGYNDLMKLIAKAEFVATSKDRRAFTILFDEIKVMERRILLAVEK